MTNKKKTTIYIKEDIYKKLKSLLALKGTTVNKWLDQKIRETLSQNLKEYANSQENT